MIISTTDRVQAQARRLRQKTLDSHLALRAVEGAGISPWEAEVLVDVVREVYFSEPKDLHVNPGQLLYVCVAISEGAGKTIDQCRKKTVLLTLHDKEDPDLRYHMGANEFRRLRLQRITEEAREQGGVLSQEDLAELLSCDVRTIRRDIRLIREKRGIFVPTRGQQKDIGPTLSHKGVAVKRWLLGDEPLDVAKRINHTLHAVERYIQRFSRVSFLRGKGFAPLQIALTVGISSAAVDTYLEIYKGTRWQSRYESRYEEIDLIGAQHYEAEDAKKGGLLRPRKRSGDGRRP